MAMAANLVDLAKRRDPDMATWPPFEPTRDHLHLSAQGPFTAVLSWELTPTTLADANGILPHPERSHLICRVYVSDTCRDRAADRVVLDSFPVRAWRDHHRITIADDAYGASLVAEIGLQSDDEFHPIVGSEILAARALIPSH